VSEGELDKEEGKRSPGKKYFEKNYRIFDIADDRNNLNMVQ